MISNAEESGSKSVSVQKSKQSGVSAK